MGCEKMELISFHFFTAFSIFFLLKLKNGVDFYLRKRDLKQGVQNAVMVRAIIHGREMWDLTPLAVAKWVRRRVCLACCPQK